MSRFAVLLMNLFQIPTLYLCEDVSTFNTESFRHIG